MALSGTATFNPDFREIAQEAFDLAGVKLGDGYDYRTARRSINLLTLEWANRGINLWTIDEQPVLTEDGSAATFLTKSQATYALAADTISTMDVILRTDDGVVASQADYALNRISSATYATIPNKLTEARPLQYLIERVGTQTTGAPRDKILLWPVPDSSTKYKLFYWRMRRMEDVGVSDINTIDVPARFLPALIMGLAYHVAMKMPEGAPKVAMLKQMYEEQFRLAAEEDREKAPVRFVPAPGIY